MRQTLVSKMRRLAALLGVLGLPLSVSQAAPGLVYFSGAPGNQFSASVLGYDNPGSETYVEQWQTLVQLEDGGLLSIFFGVHNAGLGDGHPIIALKHIDVDGSNVVDSIVGEGIRVGTDPFLLAIGPHTLKATSSGYEISVAGQRLGFSGVVTSQAEPYRAGDGRIAQAGMAGDITISTLVPRGTVQGDLRVDEAVRPVSGYAYMDHSEATLPAYAISRSWRSLRAHHAGFSLNFLSIETLLEEAVERINLMQVVTAAGQSWATLNCAFEPEAGESPEQAWRALCTEGEVKVELQVEPLQTVYRGSSLERLGAVERFFARLVIPEPMGFTVRHRHYIVLQGPNLNLQQQGLGYSEMLSFSTPPPP